MKMKHILSLFIPAFLIVGIALFVRIVQYEPLYPKDSVDETGTLTIPITEDDPYLGSKSAPNTLIVFEDLGCPGCKTQDAVISDLMGQYPSKVHVVFKPLSVIHFPAPTTKAHEYLFCAFRQGKFSQFKSVAFSQQSNLTETILPSLAQQAGLNSSKLKSCLNSEDPAAYARTVEQLAVLLNIQSVPAVFLNNQQIEPPDTVDGWKALLHL